MAGTIFAATKLSLRTWFRAVYHVTKLRLVEGFCNRSIEAFARASLDPARVVVSDGLRCFGAVAEAGCTHEVVVTVVSRRVGVGAVGK